MAFWVRRSIASNFRVDDLGQVVAASSEMDLNNHFTTDALTKSADLAAAFTAGELERIDGPAGAIVPAGSETLNFDGAFPLQYYSVKDDSMSTTTSDVFQQKLLLTADITDGDYMIFFGSLIGGTSGNTITEVQIQVDGTTTLHTSTIATGSTTVFFPDTSYDVITLATGVHTLDMSYRKSSGAGSAVIYDARLSLWRVA